MSEKARQALVDAAMVVLIVLATTACAAALNTARQHEIEWRLP